MSATDRNSGEPRFDRGPPATQGSGPVVVCLHASAGVSRQCRSLARSLGPEFELECPDLYGYGHGPRWPGVHPLRLDDEVDLVEPHFRMATAPVHLVGHGYGAAVALKAALRFPGRVASLAIFEPALFSILLRRDALHPACEELIGIRRKLIGLMRAGEAGRAARTLVDYWGGAGRWESLSVADRHNAVLGMPKVRSEWDTMYTDSTPLHAYGGLEMPILYLTGARSPAPFGRVAVVLGEVLRDARFETLDGVDHVDALVRPEPVNAQIKAFLEEVAAREAVA